MGYKVTLMKNDNLVKEFGSIKEAAEFVQEKRSDLIPERCWDTVNFSIDDDKPWIHEGDRYLFSVSKEAKEQRASRKTRK